MYALNKRIKPCPVYAVTDIAVSYGHYVLYTPPLSPNLQSIELVRGAAKNSLALDPSKKVEEISVKIGGELAIIKQHC